MSDFEGVDKLFFELASESRLAILGLLRTDALKMQEIARRLDLTSTEAFRQLNRLSDALLVQRQPDGSYITTQYGRLILQLSPALDFVFKHREYFLTHDLWQLPLQFIDRIGEMSEAELTMNTMEAINKGQLMFVGAEKYAWGMAEGQAPEVMGSAMDEQVRKGVKFRLLIPEERLPLSPVPPSMTQNLELRGLPSIPLIIGLNDREAVVCFRFADGRMDYAGFFGSDPAFLGWVRDLFSYYWERGKRQ